MAIVGDPVPQQPQQRAEVQTKQAEAVKTNVPERASSPQGEITKPEVRVSTPGYRLETRGKVDLSPRELLEWEAAFSLTTVLKARLHANGINSSLPEGSNTVNKSPVDAFKDIRPLLLEMGVLFGTEPISEADLAARTKAVQQLFTMDVLASQEPTQVVTISEISDEPTVTELQPEVPEGPIGPKLMERLFSIWTHDMKGKEIAPSGMLHALHTSRQKVIDAKGDLATDETYQKRLGMTDGLIMKTLRRLDQVLTTGLPFTSDTGQVETAAEAFPHEPMTLDTFTPMIEEAVLESGQKINLHRDKVFTQLGAKLAVDWNPEWARRFIENIVSNSQKAHTDADVDPEKQIVDVFIGVVDGNLNLVIGDRGRGYPGGMIEAWDDPKQRAKIQTGWTKNDIASTGLGFREHAAITEGQYEGRVALYNWSPEGGAATIVSMPLNNPPSLETIQRIESGS